MRTNDTVGSLGYSGSFELVGLLFHLRVADGGMGSASTQENPQVNPLTWLCNKKGERDRPNPRFKPLNAPKWFSH